MPPMRRGARSCVGALALVVLLSTAALGARGWSGLTYLTDHAATFVPSLHALASDGERLHLIYPIATTGDRAGQLVYRRSLDAGRTWEPGRILFESGPR
jgi:hypothetical protein